MNKKNIAIIISIIGVLGIGIITYLLIARQEEKGDTSVTDAKLPNSERLNKETGEYTYSGDEVKKLSEEANVNLEIGNVAVEEKKYFEKEEKEYINSEINPMYRGEIIKNVANASEWAVKVMIPMEGEVEYRIWKIEGGENKDIGKLENIGYEQYEIKVTGQELKGNYTIDKSPTDRVLYNINK